MASDFKHQKRFVLYFCRNIKYKFENVTERCWIEYMIEYLIP